MIDLGRANSILTSRASVQAVQIAEGLRFASLQEAITQLRGGSLPADLTQHFIDLLTARADGALRSAADLSASEALALGRHDEATVFAADIQEATYTSLLDDNTCDPCAEADGTVVEFGSAEYERLSPPYQDCDGGDRCRCQFVFTLKTEAPGGPVPISPLHPIAPYPVLPPGGPFPPRLPTPVTPPGIALPAPAPVPTPPPPRPAPVPPPAPPAPAPVPPRPVAPVAPPPPVPPVPVVPPEPPYLRLPPIPKDATPQEELTAIKARLAARDAHALANPIKDPNDAGFAYSLPDGRNAIVVPRDFFTTEERRAIADRGFYTNSYKDLLIITPTKTGSLYNDRNRILYDAIKARRAGSAIKTEIFYKAGYSEEHVREIERQRVLEKKLAPPGVARPRVAATPIPDEALATAQAPFNMIPGVTAPRPALVAFKDRPAIAAYLQKEFGLQHTPFEVGDLRALTPAVNEYARLSKAFPKIADKQTAFGTKALGGHPAGGGKKFQTGAYAHTTVFQGEGIMGLAPSAWKDATLLRKMLVSDGNAASIYRTTGRLMDLAPDRGFHPPGMDTYASVVTHEFGHQVDFHLKTNFAHKLSDGRTIASVRAKYEDRWMQHEGSAGLSGYALKDDKMEPFAEAFAEMSWNDPSRWSDAARAMSNMLDEIDAFGGSIIFR